MVFPDHTFLLFYIFFQFKLERTDLLALVCFFIVFLSLRQKRYRPGLHIFCICYLKEP